MKIKIIDRTRHLTNTPILFWIKTISYSIAGAATVYSVYFYYYKVENYANSLAKFSANLFGELERKKIAKRDEPIHANAYKLYLKEKKYYEKQLEEETNLRLERIKQKEIEKKTPVIVTPPTPVPKPQPETKASKTQLVLKYLTFGLWK